MISKYHLVRILLDYFVTPWLPLNPSPTEAPEEQLIATQMNAVVMLLNYYYQKQHPNVEFLCFDEFSKLALTLRPPLRAYMKLMDIINDADVENSEVKVSVTDMVIIDACDSCMHLDASKEVPNVEGWPVSGIAVMLTDSDKQNCSMELDSITQGVWSLIEKSLDNLPDDFNVKMERDASNVDETMCLQLALYAVKEARGINPNDLVVLESHNVYSLRKVKTSVRFYIMQYNQSLEKEIQLPIKRVLESMEGPLVEKRSSMWYVTSVVHYFHVLPYAALMRKWFSSQVNNDKQKEVRQPLVSTRRNKRHCLGSTSNVVIDLDSDSSG